MCGIAGGVFWNRSTDAAGAESAVAAMVRTLEHRGPDGRGVRCLQTVGPAEANRPFAVLGHTRLAIIDLSAAGAQPMGGENGSPCITYNGETYNFTEIRTQLAAAGASFSSGTDTEVILRGYDAWGIDVLQHLRGMFALALWDGRRHRLLIARDRLGIKPLYYFRGNGLFLFASEVRALLATGLVPRRLDATALWQYLGYQSIPAPRTLVDGVRLLPPGHWMTIGEDGREYSAAYWRMLDAASEPLDVSRDEALARVRHSLRDAVAAHLVSDVPVGAFLSGGIDSSAVVGLMREAGFTPRTFSIGFNEDAFDESRHSASVARLHQTEHTHVALAGTDLLDQLPEALQAMDQPTGDAVNTYVVSKAVRARGIKVALSGLGGDELFGGYPSFARLTRIADIARIWGRTPASLRTLTGTAVRALGGASVQASKAAAAIESDGSLSSMFPLTRQLLSVEQRTALIHPAILERAVETVDPYDHLLADAYAAVPGAGVFAQISFAEARTYMHDVLLRDTDQMSMAHALEVRVPLLDHRLVDLVTALPDSVKQTDGVPKRLLVESVGTLLPASIVHRPKQGFTLPFDPWMRGPLREFCAERLGEHGLTGRGLMNPDVVGRLWESFLRGGKDVSWSRLWALVVLDAWLESNPLTNQ
jgi:asparagine synthase (glutamine-hydrolysing)